MNSNIPTPSAASANHYMIKLYLITGHSAFTNQLDFNSTSALEFGNRTDGGFNTF